MKNSNNSIKMIDSKELRIGNWYIGKYPSGEKFTAQVNLGFWHSMIEDPKQHIEPIPITEEWLLKFGFDKVSYYIIDNYHCVLLSDKLEVWRFIHTNINVHIANVKYIHQLQNLYFALTEEELKEI